MRFAIAQFFLAALLILLGGCATQKAAIQVAKIENPIYNYHNIHFDLQKGEDNYIPDFINFLENCQTAEFFCLKSGGGTAFVAFVVPKACKPIGLSSSWSHAGITTRVVSSFKDAKTGKRLYLLETLGASKGAYIYAPKSGIVAILWNSTTNVPREAAKSMENLKARGVFRSDADDPEHTLAKCMR